MGSIYIFVLFTKYCVAGFVDSNYRLNIILSAIIAKFIIRRSKYKNVGSILEILF